MTTLTGGLSPVLKSNEKVADFGHDYDTVNDDMLDEELPLDQADSDRDKPDVSDMSEVSFDDRFSIPLLGTRSAAQHQRVLSALLILALLALTAAIYMTVGGTSRVSQQIGATGQMLMQSQRLAKSASAAMLGNTGAFDEIGESVDLLVHNARGLRQGQPGLPALAGAYAEDLEQIEPLVERAHEDAQTMLTQQQEMTDVASALRLLGSRSSDLLESTETVVALKLEQRAPESEVAAASQLVMLSQRIGKSASELLTVEGVSPEAIFLLSRDVSLFEELSQGLLEGNADARLSAAADPQVRDALEAAVKTFGDMQTQAANVLDNIQALATVRDAQNSIVEGSEPLRLRIETLQQDLAGASSVGLRNWMLIILSLVVVIGAIAGLVLTTLRESRQRQVLAEQQRHGAEQQELDAKRINDANQAAILRLMNELQAVAEGDLTQEATVTEDITGAIADSVNYTVEELRSLVGSVQSTATRVAQTTARVETTSSELLLTSTEQLREIRNTGESVLEMATRISAVSEQAQQSAAVARQSLQAADSGLNAVQNAIGGMDAIRDQIQETSKRIKRLGESSQEIGEITELISDITEQTNVLALNAAIQAASAGEAGRGFSVVAEEVQRLAERSADATRQIATLVKAIQTDTQDAVAAMERSTRGVVEGAQLSDRAGTALSEIDEVSRRLAELIEQISTSASEEAGQASEVASNIQKIFVTTERTGESTRSTAEQVRDLARMADELRQSVARFKIA